MAAKNGHSVLCFSLEEDMASLSKKMVAINDFFEELSPEIEAMWSVFKNKAEDGLIITAICTNEV